MLNIFCEGPTEGRFCKQVLQPHFFPDGNGLIQPLAVGVKNHRHVYGLGMRTPYEKVAKFITRTIAGRLNSEIIFTTMFDIYAIPIDFPLNQTISTGQPRMRVENLERAFAADIQQKNQCLRPHQFIPYLQLHEFETLLFAMPDAFALEFDNPEKGITQLNEAIAENSDIELINDHPETAPSKRIIRAFPEYRERKSSAGPSIAEYIGLPTIRTKCQHFDKWITALEHALWTEQGATHA